MGPGSRKPWAGDSDEGIGIRDRKTRPERGEPEARFRIPDSGFSPLALGQAIRMRDLENGIGKRGLSERSRTAPMLDAQLNAFAALGSRFWPFRTIDRVASFFHAAARHPVGTPDRDARVAGMLDCPADATVVGKQLGKLEQSPAAAALIDALPVSDGASLVCSRTDCVLCGERLACGLHKVGRGYGSTEVVILAEDGAKRGTMYQKVCSACHAVHYVSYATGGKLGG